MLKIQKISPRLKTNLLLIQVGSAIRHMYGTVRIYARRVTKKKYLANAGG